MNKGVGVLVFREFVSFVLCFDLLLEGFFKSCCDLVGLCLCVVLVYLSKVEKNTTLLSYLDPSSFPAISC